MRVFARFLIVIVLLVGSFLALLLATEMFQRRQSAAVVARATARRETALSAAFSAASIPLQAFVEGLRISLREGSVGTGSPADGSFQIGGSPAAMLIDGPHGASEFRSDGGFPASLATALRDAAASEGSEAPSRVFFIGDGTHVAECHVGLMWVGDAQVRFAVARLWSEKVLARVTALSGGAVSISFGAPPPGNFTADGKLTRRQLSLIGGAGAPIASLEVNFESLSIEQLRVLGAQKLMVMLAFSFVVMVVLAFALTRWIARPIGLIGQSLAAQDAAPLRTLLASQAEFGQFAQLVKTTLDQKAELGREIEVRKRAEAAFLESVEERLRLSRDLHDGVIQSIYASGLTLEGIKPLINSDPAEAQRRLELCVHALNETIAELRRYLLRSGELPARRQASVHEELHRMAETLRAGRNTEIALDVVEDAAARLDPDAALQLLLIGREAITNALRHSGAKTIAVTLRPETDRMVVFEVRDDGSGQHAESIEGRGHGLANMTRRAEELGGSFEIESRPGVGTRVRVELPVKAQVGG